MPSTRRAHRRSLLILATLLAACDKPFEPLAPTDLVFSIYGHLDAGTDTQWVRVMPLRESVEMPAGPIDAVVTLEELETGTTVVMNDSLVRYLPVFLDDADLYAHNFWTTMPMVGGRHYRLTATRSDGASASAAVLVPTFDDPTLVVRDEYLNPGNSTSNELRLTHGTIHGTRFIAMVLGREKVPPDCNIPLQYHQEYLPVVRPAATDGDFHDVQLAWGGSRPSFVGYPPACENGLEPRKILVIGSGEEWPYEPSNRLRDLSHLSSFSNIENQGLGFLAGVHTQTFSYARCLPIDRARPCTITFGPRSATLVARMSNSCTGEPAESIRVSLLSPPTNAARAEVALLSGIVRFEGLEPGLSHPLTLTQLPRPPFQLPDYDTIEVEAAAIEDGATDTVFIEMTPRMGCAQWGRGR